MSKKIIIVPNKLTFVPGLSVIVVTLADRDDIECLDYLRQGDYEDYEVIISRKRGISAARNDGIQQATTDKLVFLDDDAYPQPGYLELADELLEEHPIVAGRVIHPEDDIFSGLAQNRAYDQGPTPGEVETVVGCNMLFRREVFETVGYFDENIKWGHEESLFAENARSEFPIFYHPDLAVEHTFEDSIIDWWRKQLRYGQSDVYAAKARNKMVFSEWYEMVPVSGGRSITEILVKTIGKNIRNASRLAAMARGMLDPPTAESTSKK